MIGIDFGTTTTEIALCKDGRAELLADPDGEVILPTVVGYLPGGRRVVGRDALKRRLIDPANTLSSVKRIIGLKWFDKSVAEFRSESPYEMEKGDDDLPRFVTRAGRLTAGEVARHVFESLHEDPRVPKGRQVIVTAPPSFDREQRMAVTVAALEAGFEKVNVIDEPYAAILPYLKRGEDERTVVVYDLGGGTFDVAVLRLRGLVHRVLASGGDPYLGGDDLDRAISNQVIDRVLETLQWDIRTSAEAVYRLVGECQRAKVRLSARPETRIPLDLVDPVLAGKELTIDRAELDRAIHTLVQSTFAICDDVLREAGLVAQQVDEVVLAGGSTYLPSIRSAVEQYFRRPPTTTLPPDRVVALGASLSAAIHEGDRRVLGAS